MKQNRPIDVDTIEKELCKVRDLASKDAWPEVRQGLATARDYLDQLGESSAYVLWLSAVAADNIHELEEAVRFVTRARVLDRFEPSYAQSERIIFEHLRASLDERGEGGDAQALRSYELLLQHGQADNRSHLTAAYCYLAAGNVEVAARIADALTLLSPSCADAWRLQAVLARRAGNETRAAELDTLAIAAGRTTMEAPAAGGRKADA